jgi:SAM-dependent methyltransferase
MTTRQLGTGGLRRRVQEFSARALRSVVLRVQKPSDSDDDAGSESDFVFYRGHRLPPKRMRAMMCGDAFQNEQFYFMSAVLEATKFTERLSAKDALVVDIGSGLGRLATGLIAESSGVQYIGIDANQEFVRWCTENIESQHPNFRFVHLDMANDRYNPNGTLDGSALRLPVEDASADVVNLWGVFTNMVPEHVQAFVREIGRILRPHGQCFLTAFAEDDVPDVTLNPENYVPYAVDGPLTAVRYSKPWLISTFRQQGLEVEEFRHHGSMFPKQSEIYLVKADTGKE